MTASRIRIETSAGILTTGPVRLTVVRALKSCVTTEPAIDELTCSELRAIPTLDDTVARVFCSGIMRGRQVMLSLGGIIEQD